VRLLRGMVCYFRGDAVRAISELEQAVKLLPKSVAARALLAVSYHANGEYLRGSQLLHELERLSASSAEDYLFKGLAREPLGGGGLADLNEGIRRRDSPLGRALRAEARSTRAAETGDQKEVEEALADANAAWLMVRDNPKVLQTSILARVIAAFIYQEAGLREKRAGVLREAERDVRALEPVLDDLPTAFFPTWLFYEHTGERGKALKVARRALERSRSPLAASLCAIDLYRLSTSAEGF
jgi:tetratricopeptide (TPR) repeat protein